MIGEKTILQVMTTTEVKALVAMEELANFCKKQPVCELCPFYWIDKENRENCFLTRTNKFTPGDWNIDELEEI